MSNRARRLTSAPLHHCGEAREGDRVPTGIADHFGTGIRDPMPCSTPSPACAAGAQELLRANRNRLHHRAEAALLLRLSVVVTFVPEAA